MTRDSQVGETELEREAEAINSAELMVRVSLTDVPKGGRDAEIHLHEWVEQGGAGWSRLSHHLILCDISESV